MQLAPWRLDVPNWNLKCHQFYKTEAPVSRVIRYTAISARRFGSTRTRRPRNKKYERSIRSPSFRNVSSKSMIVTKWMFGESYHS